MRLKRRQKAPKLLTGHFKMRWRDERKNLGVSVLGPANNPLKLLLQLAGPCEKAG